MNSTGTPHRAQSTTFCDVARLHFRGDVGAAGKDRQRFFLKRPIRAADDELKVLHQGEPLGAEGPRHHGFRPVQEAQEKTISVGDGLGHVGGDEGRALRRKMGKALHKAHHAQVIRGVGPADFLGRVIEGCSGPPSRG